MRAIAAMLLMTLVTPALAEWTRVGSSDGAEYFVDQSTMRRSPPTVRVWLLFRPKQIGPGQARSFRALTVFDCVEERYRDLQTTYFSEPNENGKVLGQVGEGQWIYTAPDTVMLDLLRFVCAP